MTFELFLTILDTANVKPCSLVERYQRLVGAATSTFKVQFYHAASGIRLSDSGSKSVIRGYLRFATNSQWIRGYISLMAILKFIYYLIKGKLFC